MGNTKDGNYEINTEIKSLNSKFADISVRMPSQWSSLELVLRKQISDALLRGKIGVSIEVINRSVDVSTLFDDPIFPMIVFLTCPVSISTHEHAKTSDSIILLSSNRSWNTSSNP